MPDAVRRIFAVSADQHDGVDDAVFKRDRQKFVWYLQHFGLVDSSLARYDAYETGAIRDEHEAFQVRHGKALESVVGKSGEPFAGEQNGAEVEELEVRDHIVEVLGRKHLEQQDIGRRQRHPHSTRVKSGPGFYEDFFRGPFQDVTCNLNLYLGLELGLGLGTSDFQVLKRAQGD